MDITEAQVLKFQKLHKRLELQCLYQSDFMACKHCSRKLLEAAAEALKAPQAQEKPVEPKKQEDTRVPACKYECDNTATPMCSSRDEGWSCTRDKGHSGDHVACGDKHAIHTWPNGKETGNENRG